MEKENEYRIPISGLALGQHTFHYVIKDEFFAGMDYSEVQQGDVLVDLDIEREEYMMTLTFHINGKVLVPCDRCADEFYIPIQNDQVFFIKLGNEPIDEADDVVALSPDEHDFDLSSLIYEFIILSIPMHRVHPEGECNPEVLALLSHDEEPVEDEEVETDPRWAALKDLTIEDN